MNGINEGSDDLAADEDMEKRFGGHLGAILHGSIYPLRKAEWFTTMPGTSVGPPTVSQRFLHVGRDPLSAMESPTAIVLSAGIDKVKYSIHVCLEIRGPKSIGWKRIFSRHSILRARSVFLILHELVPMPFMGKLLHAVSRAAAPMSPKHWNRRRRTFAISGPPKNLF